MKACTLAQGAQFGSLVWVHPYTAIIGGPHFVRFGDSVEIVRSGVLSALYFPIPQVVIKAQGSETMRDLKRGILEQTYLKSDQDRIKAFLAQAPLLMALTRRQAK